jgi:glycogen operon protein
MPNDTGDLLADAHAMVATSPSLLMLVQADDLAGETEAVNLPGTDQERPNWRRRLEPSYSELFTGQPGQTIIAALGSRRPEPRSSRA